MRAGDESCKACFGGAVACKGGGNLRCHKRNPQAARIALILGPDGGARTVIAPREEIMEHHTGLDELAYIVPKLRVHEPIAWNDIPLVIERARIEFEKWLNTRPNLTAELQQAVVLYFLHQKRHPDSKYSISDLSAIVET